MKELIEEQCGYRPSEQLLLYENTKLDEETSDHSFSADKLPITTDTNPVLLYHCSDPLSNTDEHPIKHNIRELFSTGTWENTTFHLELHDIISMVNVCSNFAIDKFAAELLHAVFIPHLRSTVAKRTLAA